MGQIRSTIAIAAPAQDFVKIEVSYFDDAEREKLRSFESAPQMEALVKSGLKVSVADLLTNYLFHRIRPGAPNWSSYTHVADRVGYAVAHMDGTIAFNGESIALAEGATDPRIEVIEHLGEAIGLAVLNELHGLTLADWTRIPQQRGRGSSPTFDFDRASDGKSEMQLEAKGSSSGDNRVHSSNVIAQKNKIVAKKNKLAVRLQKGTDPFPSEIRYGTIAVVDQRKESITKCWLLDPPPEGEERPPRDFRLLARMTFLQQTISFLIPRSQLAAALATRLAALTELSNPFELNGIPLRRANFEEFDVLPKSVLDLHSPLMAQKARVLDGPAAGVSLISGNDAVLFVGIQQQLLELAVDQNFDAIENYERPSGSVTKHVHCVMPATKFGRIRNLMDQRGVPYTTRESSGHVEFDLEGTLQYSSAGLVWGLLPISNEFEKGMYSPNSG